MGETGRSHSDLHLAAICHGGGGHIDRLMAEVAAGLRAQGCRLCGVIQSNPAPAPGQRCDMLLEELSSGEKFPISQRLGLESQACRLDSAALEEVVHLVERSLGDAPDMLLLNKFGRQESEGKGLRMSIARQGPAAGARESGRQSLSPALRRSSLQRSSSSRLR